MSGKIEFGCDYLHLTRMLIWEAKPESKQDEVSDAAAKLFLLQWGFSVEEVDQANALFFERVNTETLGEFHPAYQRIVAHVSKDRTAQERLVTQLAALGAMDFQVTDGEANFVRWFMGEFDLRPSEFQDLCQRGWDLAVGLDYFGTAYMENKKGSR